MPLYGFCLALVWLLSSEIRAALVQFVSDVQMDVRCLRDSRRSIKRSNHKRRFAFDTLFRFLRWQADSLREEKDRRGHSTTLKSIVNLANSSSSERAGKASIAIFCTTPAGNGHRKCSPVAILDDVQTKKRFPYPCISDT